MRPLESLSARLAIRAHAIIPHLVLYGHGHLRSTTQDRLRVEMMGFGKLAGDWPGSRLSPSEPAAAGARSGRDPTDTAPPVGRRSRPGTAAGTDERSGRAGLTTDEHGSRVPAPFCPRLQARAPSCPPDPFCSPGPFSPHRPADRARPGAARPASQVWAGRIRTGTVRTRDLETVRGSATRSELASEVRTPSDVYGKHQCVHRILADP
jgi:hypothetical protein